MTTMTTTPHFEPDTVAVATVDGRPNVRVLRYELGWMFVNAGFQAWRDDRLGTVTDVRPLVVLDLDGYDAEKFTRILRAMLRGEGKTGGFAGPWARVAEGIADQIEAQTKPPRIPEPGLWGVVAVNGRNYVRTAEYCWRSGDYTAEWDDIADGARIVREGIDD